jgi:hydrogenase maturation protease
MDPRSEFIPQGLKPQPSLDECGTAEAVPFQNANPPTAVYSTPARCLILACGNTLREDDGVGPWLAAWAEERFRAEPGVRVVSVHQWTPELAEDVAGAESVIFVDCAMNSKAGSVSLMAVDPCGNTPAVATHHLDASQLLSLSKELYGAIPHASLQLTLGVESLELREGFSEAAQAALPAACAELEKAVFEILAGS